MSTRLTLAGLHADVVELRNDQAALIERLTQLEQPVPVGPHAPDGAPPWVQRYAKAVTALVVTAAGALGLVDEDGLTLAEVLSALAAAAASSGLVAAVPNATPPAAAS